MGKEKIITEEERMLVSVVDEIVLKGPTSVYPIDRKTALNAAMLALHVLSTLPPRVMLKVIYGVPEHFKFYK